MGNALRYVGQPAETEDARGSAPSSDPSRHPTPRPDTINHPPSRHDLSTSSGSSATSSSSSGVDLLVDEADDELGQQARVAAWVLAVVRAQEAAEAKRADWRSERDASERGSSASKPRCAQGRKADKNVTPMRGNRVYVVDVNRSEGRAKGAKGRPFGRRGEIEEITEQECRRRVGTASKCYQSPSRPAIKTRTPVKIESVGNFGRSATAAASPVKASVSCVDAGRRAAAAAEDGVERLEFVVDEPAKLMNRENRPLGDCVVPEGRDARQARTMRSYEYRRAFGGANGEWDRADDGECQRSEGRKHCASKMAALRC